MTNLDLSSFAGHANDWTLKNDIELKEVLQSLISNMRGKINQMEMASENLVSDVNELEIRLKHIHNRIGCTKMERLVEENIDDIDELILAQKREASSKITVKNQSREEYEQRTISAISSAVRKGFQLLATLGPDDDDEQFSSADPVDPDGAGPSSCQIPTTFENPFACRLPTIIGSKEFFESMKKKQMEVKPKETNLIRESTESGASAAIITSKTKEEDIESTSSNRSVPPQDPMVSEKAGSSSRNALLADEIVERIAKMNTRKEVQTVIIKTGSTDELAKSVQRQKDEDTGKVQVQRIQAEEKHPSPEQPKLLLTADNVMVPKQQQIGDLRPSGNKNIVTQPPLTSGTIIKKRQTRKTTRKSLFSSSSSDDEENIEATTAAVVGSRQNMPSSKTPPPVARLESTVSPANPEHYPLAEEQESRSVLVAASPEEEEEDMSKPVFKTFDTAFSDRLAAAIQNGPVTLRPERAMGRRPLSAHSLASSGDEGPPKVLRKTESVVSANEELGPASVKARIAQIGAKIPIGRGGGGGREEESNESRAAESKEAPMPTHQAEALKSRAKGPTRRAPTQGRPQLQNVPEQLPPRSSAVPSNETPAEMERPKPPVPTVQNKMAVPPTVPPKQKGRSIFSSSSSEDELKARVPVKPMPKKEVPLPTPRQNIEIVKQPPPVQKKTEPSKQRRGLFDDSDSDF